MKALSRRRLLGSSLALATLPPLLASRAAQAAPEAPSDAASRITITFNTDGVKRLLEMAAAKRADDAALDAFVDLPPYKNLLRVGEAEGTLTRDQLKANAKAVALGTATVRDQPRGDAGRLLLTDPDTYRKMLDDLDKTAAERTARIAARLAAFAPASALKEPLAQTVYLHLGGNWDALNVGGDIFLNLHYWHDYNRPSLDGLNLVVSHEMTHTLQNRAYGNPEAQSDGVGSFLTALSKIQREGTARYVEVETDPEEYGPYTYGFFYRAVDTETLRAFPNTLPMLEAIRAACFPTFDKQKFVDTYSVGIDNGGPYYTIGHGIAKVIDERLGRRALLETMERGPKEFYSRYADLSRKERALPRLPDPVVEAIRTMPERLPPGTT